MKKFFFLILFPHLVAFASMQEEYTELFSEKFSQMDIKGCYEVLDNWEINSYEDYGVIEGFRAALYLAEGDLQSSNLLMETALASMTGTILTEKSANLIRDYYQKAWVFDEELIEMTSATQFPAIQLCEKKQPKGVRFKYWVGIAQIVAGCVAAPFSAGASTVLISMGVSTTISAVSDCMNNMEQWEDNLNRRQRIGPDNISFPCPGRISSFCEITKL